MNTFLSFFLWYCTQFVVCHRDFYLGMFKRNDFLVAQDVVYKDASHFGYTTASYGRLFKCPISYFRVIDRLGVGRGPITSVVRGGLRNNKIAVRIKSSYNLPVSVNIYVGCANKQPSTIKRLTRATLAQMDTTAGGADNNTMTTGMDGTAGTGGDGKTGGGGEGGDKAGGEGDGGAEEPPPEEA